MAAFPRFAQRSGEVPARAATDGGPLNANDLSAVLWRERTLLDVLIRKLETVRNLLEEGSLDLLPQATEETGQILGRLRLAELGRSVEVAVLAADWGARDDVTLTGLAAQAPTSVWAELLGAHHAAMTEQAHRILALREHNHATLERAGVRARNEYATIQSSDEQPGSPSHGPDTGKEAEYLDLVLREAIIQGAQAVNVGALPGTLREFLRIPGRSQLHPNRT